MSSDPTTVHVGAAAAPALGEPQFLIEKDGKLYLTLAVLEFDTNHPGITPQQEASIAQLQAMLGGGGLRAALFDGSASAAPVQDVIVKQPQQAGMTAKMKMAGPSLGLQFAQTNPPPNDV